MIIVGWTVGVTVRIFRFDRVGETVAARTMVQFRGRTGSTSTVISWTVTRILITLTMTMIIFIVWIDMTDCRIGRNGMKEVGIVG